MFLIVIAWRGKNHLQCVRNGSRCEKKIKKKITPIWMNLRGSVFIQLPLRGRVISETAHLCRPPAVLRFLFTSFHPLQLFILWQIAGPHLTILFICACRRGEPLQSIKTEKAWQWSALSLSVEPEMDECYDWLMVSQAVVVRGELNTASAFQGVNLQVSHSVCSDVHAGDNV